MDPTLPRINTIKCPNQACKSNQEHEHEHAHAETPRSRPRAEGGKSKASIGAAAAEILPGVEADVEEQGGGAGAATDHEIIYLRYDDVNMNFVYLCPVCDSVWNTTQ